MRRNPALVDDHAALNIASPSSDAVQALLAFWRRTTDDGELDWSFTDSTLSTRFLGDLYQDLSDFAKKKYALLQTPEFVEEFILDRTLEPAFKDRPLDGFRLIDPTCGSGHFLLGAFARLVERWHQASPGMELRSRVDHALASVYGVDLNPFAVAIAKFRLIVAALQACGETSLLDAPKFTLNLAAGDSLLHAPEKDGTDAFDFDDRRVDKNAIASGFSYSTEDAATLRKFLTPGSYDVVVGNPPYIVVSDKALNARYRELYSYCKGKYALTVPFMELFFKLARTGERAGWTGQITSNSFMKREFGVPLIEDFLSNKDLELIADTSGAYIPGHGTPTVIIVGRNRGKRRDTVRAVLGIQGEPEAPKHPSQGLVWSTIVKNIDSAGYEDQWISITDLPRQSIAEHPWSLTGGGASEILSQVVSGSITTLGATVDAIGRTTHTGLDDAFYIPLSSATTRSFASDTAPLVLGEDIRDYSLSPNLSSLLPYDDQGEPRPLSDNAMRILWLNRTALSRRVDFEQTLKQRGLRWFDHSMFFKKRYRTPLSIAFAFVATHNHFVLDRGGKVFKQSAPVIKLPKDATEDDHLRLLGTLSSSTACFWLKQNSYPKGGDPIGQEGARVSSAGWSDRYEFTGTTLADFPLTPQSPLGRTRLIDQLARDLAEHEPAHALTQGATKSVIESARVEHARLRARMIAEQEELDWEVYRHYGLISDNLTVPVATTPEIKTGQRAFEIVLACRVAAGELDTSWFSRHGSTPITEVPSHWPDAYRQVVETRIAAIESNKFVRLLERPEYKRRWTGDSWDTKLQEALKNWLLDKLEDRSLWFAEQGTPLPRSVGELAGRVETDPEFIEALDLWAGQKDAPVTATLVTLLADQTVPYLAALRYKDSGLRKRAEWERVWDLQRQEDAGFVSTDEIPVPPKYTGSDFVKQSYWSHRGKLDVPKERFILYPDVGRDTDPTPLLGWAGWDHAQQGIALATIYSLRESEGVDLGRLIPLVAGISELLPWVRQWHSGVDPAFGLDLFEYLTAQLREKSAAVGVAIDDLKHWRPVPKARGRQASSRKVAPQ